MRALLSVVVLLVASSCRGGTSAGEEAPEISAQDVHHFVDAYKQLTPSDTTCAPLARYLSQQSRGLRAYRRKFEVGQSDICAAIRRSPGGYAALESKLGALDSATSLIRAVFDKFSALHPLGKMPGVYFVVGNGISGGTTTRGIDPIILIGMELNRSTEGLSGLIAHELVHTQQDYPLLGSMTGGPKLLRGSVLRHSIKEGSANFLAELMTGQPHRHAYGEAHEAQLWAEFRREASSKDYSRWLYNGWNKSLGDRPPDLGYWMGYRITKSYFEQAADKRQAISDILSIKDFDRFLAVSGYAGGVTRAPGRPGA